MSQVTAGYLSLGEAEPAMACHGGACMRVYSRLSSSPFSGSDGDFNQKSESADLLPAIALVYTPTPSLGFRLSYGGTVARPLVRELAPFNRTSFGGERSRGTLSSTER